MCGRYSLRNPRGHRWLADAPEGTLRPRYNIAPSQRVVVLGRSAEGERVARTATWGFRPRWLEGKRKPPINARAETAATTPMFRTAFQRGRCLLPADGWYEWQSQERGPKVPYFFHRPDDALFWLAGLATTDAEGERTVAVLTTDANATARAIHGRMPVMLPDDEAAAAWIEPEADAGSLEDVLRPAPDEFIDTYPVSRRVNKPDNYDPKRAQPAPD